MTEGAAAMTDAHLFTQGDQKRGSFKTSVGADLWYR
jgi:hypothetical protein